MRWPIALLVLVLGGCGAGHKARVGRPISPRDFATKLAARDVASVRALFRDEVSYRGLLFSDASCAEQFATPGASAGAAVDELARCLTALQLQPSGRTDDLPDVAVLTYAPGIEIEAQFAADPRGPYVKSIGFVGAAREDTLPTIAATALEAHRLAGAADGPLPADVDLNDELALAPFVWAWLKICVDGEGSVTRSQVREASSPRIARLVEAAVKTWQFKPFTIGEQPIAACSMVRVAHPAADADNEVLPLVRDPDTELVTVPNIMLGPRREGTTNVVPDDFLQRELVDAGVVTLVSAFQFCLDATGKVSRVTPIRATGYAKYDAALVAAIEGWRYAPFLDDAQPVPVCSSVRVVYTQRD